MALTPAVWPLTLPQGQLLDGVQEIAPGRMIRSATDIGPMKSRPRWTKGIRVISLGIGGEFIDGRGGLTSLQVDQLLLFHRVDCLGGQRPFIWIHPRTGAESTLRFIRAPHISPLGADTWKASLELEILPDWAVAQLPTSLPVQIPPPFLFPPLEPEPEPPPEPPPPEPPNPLLTDLLGIWIFDGSEDPVPNIVTNDPADQATLIGGASMAPGYLQVNAGNKGAIIGPPLRAFLRPPTTVSMVVKCQFLGDGGGINPNGIIVVYFNDNIQWLWSFSRPQAGSFAMDNDAIRWQFSFPDLIKQDVINRPLDYTN